MKASPSSVEDSETTFDVRGLRLRRWAKYSAIIISLGTLLPYEIIDGHPQFLWHVFGELPLAGLVAYLTPILVGGVILTARGCIEDDTTLGVVVLAALAVGAGLIALGSDATAWTAFQMPTSITAGPSWTLLILAATAAGACATFEERNRAVGRWLLRGAVALSLCHYLIPVDGLSPIETVWDTLVLVVVAPNVQLQMGFALLATIALWPALIACIGLVWMRSPAEDPNPGIALVAIFGLPLVLSTFVYRAIPTGGGFWEISAGAAGVVLLAAIVAILAYALETAAVGLFATPDEDSTPIPLSARRPMAIQVLAVSLVIIASQALFAQPPEKGVDWTLKAPSTAGDTLFGTTIPAWNLARLYWTRSARHQSGAEALLKVKGAARKMVQEANTLDASLAKALEEMGRASRDLDLAGRGWNRVVGRANEAIRASGLPYYLDPTVLPYKWQGERRRHFGMRTHRVLRVRQFEVADKKFATLHVERLDTSRGKTSLLGFSRDQQPFAIVDRRESHGFRDELKRYAQADPPQCSADSSAALGLRVCGNVLAKVVARLPDLGAGISALTDRHELQHQIDGPHLRIPAGLRKAVPYGPQRLQQANRELSAYLAEMTGTDVDPHLCLVHVGRFAMLGARDMLQHVALVILGTMTDQHLYDADDEPDQHRVAAAFARLSEMTTEELRTRAAEAWATLYGEDLPTIVERSAP